MALVMVSAMLVVGTLTFDHARSDDRLVYVWSPRMPLSVEGLPEAEAAAAALGVRFESVELDAAHAEAGPGRALPDELAGSELHVPSAALVTSVTDGDEVRTVLGFKTRHALVAALRAAVPTGKGAGEASRRGAPRMVRPETPRLDGAPAEGDDVAPAELRWVGDPEPGSPGFFYRLIPGTTQFVLDRRGTTWVHDTESGVRWAGPADLDLVPSPDAAFLVAPLDRGLAFYSWADLRRVGPAGGGPDLPPFHVDPEMDDQYPSVGLLGDVDEGRRVRVLVSWFAGVRIRDYVVSTAADGGLRAAPVGDVVQPCPAVRLSTPILSPDGTRVSGRDESTATTKVFDIGASGAECTEVADVGYGTSKATFSPSSRYLAYSRWGTSSGRRMAQVHVLDLEAGASTPVPGATSSRLLIPDFGREEEILILAVRDDTRFEIHCWRGACPGSG